jgi:hypothetical protein
MNIELLLEEKLRKFSIIDFALVKWMYFFLSLFICSLIPGLPNSGWFFYFVLSLLCNVPLMIHLFSQEGTLLEKMHAYLKTNGPANQMLVFLSVFFFTIMLCSLLPILAIANTFTFLIIAVLLAVKPVYVAWVE